MIDRIDKMLMWVLSLGTFIIAVVALIGGYLVWNNAQFRKQAQVDLEAIRSSKEQVDKVVVEVKAINTQFLKDVSTVTSNLNKATEEVKSISDMKKIAHYSVQEIEKINDAYYRSNLALGTISAAVSPSASKHIRKSDQGLGLTYVVEPLHTEDKLAPIKLEGVEDVDDAVTEKRVETGSKK